MDGGTIYGLNIDSAINQCLEVVDDPSDIILDVMICGVLPPPTGEEKTGNTIQNMKRKKSWQDYYKANTSVVEQLKAYPTVNLRYFFEQ